MRCDGNTLSCYSAGVAQVLIIRMLFESLALFQVMRSGTFRIIPLWCLWVVFDLCRLYWLDFRIGPEKLLYGAFWKQTEPIWLLLIFLATAEAYYRPSTYYRGSKKAVAIFASILIGAGALITIAVCLPVQLQVVWSSTELRDRMQQHQIWSGVAGVWMFTSFLVYRILFVQIPPFLYAHGTLMGLYGLVEASVYLVNNSRVFHNRILASIDDVLLAFCFSLWVWESRKDFVDVQPQRQATTEEISRAKQEAESFLDSIRKKKLLTSDSGSLDEFHETVNALTGGRHNSGTTQKISKPK